MISMVQPLLAGNAIRLFVTPPVGARYWRVLKMATDSFGGPDDLASAVIAYEGDDLVFVDAHNLLNEVMVFYRPFYRMPDDTWQAGATANGTPAAAYEDIATDVQSFVRERLEAGMKVEVDRQNLLNDLGYIQVYTAPPSLEQNLKFPLVTITLDDESPSQRAIGEEVSGDDFDAVGSEWFESEGWLSEVSLSIIGWSLNSDERIELRKALRRIIIANLPIFASKGMDQVNLTMQDVDALSGEYNANIYQVMATFSCVAAVRVGRRYGEGEIVTDVLVENPGFTDTSTFEPVPSFEGLIGASIAMSNLANNTLSENLG